MPFKADTRAGKIVRASIRDIKTNATYNRGRSLRKVEMVCPHSFCRTLLDGSRPAEAELIQKIPVGLATDGDQFFTILSTTNGARPFRAGLSKISNRLAACFGGKSFENCFVDIHGDGSNSSIRKCCLDNASVRRADAIRTVQIR